ncbi:MAG: 16S rRNA (adenine(1518)-N(6)/adenine(1519)-N(6))-dimethyltransferase RsmA [Actinomycetia bacterium]|nr:16S rRNA (adenine(1518)-N(6)/adenine(1519)-N(6))-dimethyltransferase RsmA [Actinomycetes bacterium]
MPEHSPLASPKATIAALRDYGLYTKKSLGQHFLIDDGVVGKILKLAKPAPEATLLEVGPGIGTLTLALLATGNPVIAVEKDAALLPVLQRISGTEGAAPFVTLRQDALDLDALAGHLPQTPLELVANLPYQVAATVVLAYFEHLPHLQSATVMVQREVAERMKARPATKAYGAYTVKLALLASVTGSFSVARTSFLPPPRVDSTVIRLERRASVPLPGTDHADLAAFVDAAFAMRRKTLLNNLRAAWPACPPDRLVVALAKRGFAPNLRAEALSPEDFIQLFTDLRRTSAADGAWLR